jgi:hypothetical protein
MTVVPVERKIQHRTTLGRSTGVIIDPLSVWKTVRGRFSAQRVMLQALSAMVPLNQFLRFSRIILMIQK